MAVATNLGTGGSVLDAQYGSTVAPNTNEPLLLGHTGTNYLYLPAVNGNYASAPDSAALDIIGDIDLRVRVSLDDWTPAAEMALLGKWKAATNERSYALTVAAAGTLVLRYSTTGTDSLLFSSSVAPSLVDGTSYWVRVTLDVDNGASGATAAFYFAADQATEPTSWTQVGTSQTVAGVVALASMNSTLGIGAINDGSGFPAAGKVYRAIVRNGIGGTAVFDADFTSGITSGAQTTFTATTGQTVTINRSTAGRKSCAVVRPVFLLGADDVFVVADNDLLDFGTGDFTVVVVARLWNMSTSAQQDLIGKGTGATGWVLVKPNVDLVGIWFDNGAPRASSPPRTSGNVIAFTATRSSSAITVSSGTPGTSAASLTNASAMKIGYSDLGGSHTDAELLAVAVFRRALTAAELATIATYYGAS